jgi:hypothetical protein
MALGIQFDLLPKEDNANTDQLLYQREEHSGSSSERVLCREVSEESSQCTRKCVACDTSAWKKLKALDDRVDEP